MKAILTRYFPASEFRGSRIIATAEGGHRVTTSYDDGAHDPHATACRALLAKVGWGGTWIGGGMPDGSVAWVYQDTDRSDPNRVVRMSEPK